MRTITSVGEALEVPVEFFLTSDRPESVFIASVSAIAAVVPLLRLITRVSESEMGASIQWRSPMLTVISFVGRDYNQATSD